MAEHNDLINLAYELLSDADKVQLDLQVKRILDYYAALNQGRTLAKFQMSRDMALELLYRLGRFSQAGGKIA